VMGEVVRSIGAKFFVRLVVGWGGDILRGTTLTELYCSRDLLLSCLVF
jgi:hypothetical protein